MTQGSYQKTPRSAAQSHTFGEIVLVHNCVGNSQVDAVQRGVGICPAFPDVKGRGQCCRIPKHAKIPRRSPPPPRKKKHSETEKTGRITRKKEEGTGAKF